MLSLVSLLWACTHGTHLHSSLLLYRRSVIMFSFEAGPLCSGFKWVIRKKCVSSWHLNIAPACRLETFPFFLVRSEYKCFLTCCSSDWSCRSTSALWASYLNALEHYERGSLWNIECTLRYSALTPDFIIINVFMYLFLQKRIHDCICDILVMLNK